MSPGACRHTLACLLYHEIAGSDSTTYFGVSATQLTTQLERLDELGLRGCSLEAALGAPERAVAITFDDGHASHYSLVFPELQRRSMTATFFVPTGWVGTPNRVTWEQLREMVAAGMSVQSHTVSHPFLSELGPEAVRRELTDSKRRLDEELDQDTRTIALPGGDFPRGWNVRDFEACSYPWIATSRWGSNRLEIGSDRPAPILRRYTVRRGTSVRRFDQLLLGSSSALSPEGTRLMILNQLRSIVGARRYAVWRARFLRRYGG